MDYIKLNFILLLFTCYNLPSIFTKTIIDSSNDAINEYDLRIVGGNDASLGQFPYYCSLRTSMNYHFCGCAILTNTWVLTAANCVHMHPIASLRMYMGTVQLKEGDYYDAEAVRIHPNYVPGLWHNDIALVKSINPFEFNENVKPVELDNQYRNVTANLVATGFGRKNFSDVDLSEILQYLPMWTLTNSDCRSRHNSANAEHILDTNICGYYGNNKGMCTGDSGGPLVLNNKLVGVFSWTVYCGQTPDVFTRVYSYVNWIESVISF